MLSVWFQNRRAKWRRQEKAEQNALKINTDYPLASLVRSGSSTLPNSLPMDPLMTPPITNSTQLHSLPGFLSHPSSTYPSYLSPVSSSAILGHTLINAYPGGFNLKHQHQHQYQQQQQQNGSLSTPSEDERQDDEADPRNSSIFSLRLRAKEHVESIIGKGFPIPQAR